MSTLADFRRKYPQYDDMGDAELAEALHQKYYSDLPKEDVFKRLAVRPTEAAPAPTPAPAPLTSTRVTAPPKEVKPAGIFDYFTDRQAAIKQDREYRAYLQDKMQRAELEDIETQTGFFDRLGDLFSRGLLTARSGIKDVEAAIEADPALKKQFTQEARKFAADSRTEITGATTEQDVKDNFLRNAIPYIIEKGAESLPQMFASTNPLGVLGVALPSNLGGQAREAAELQGRQDVSGADVAKVAPGALAVTALDTLGLGGILAAPAKTALGRIGKAALLEGGTEAIQSAIEYANPRVVTGSDIDAGELFEQAAFGALAGGGIGGGLRGVGEIAAAPFRRKAEAQPSSLAADSPEVEQEYLRLVAAEAQALVDADPNLTQRQAFNQVMKGDTVGKLYDTAVANILLGPEEGTDVDTGVDVTGGSGASVAPDIEPAPTKTGAPDLGEVVGGRLERPVSGVSVPDVGTGAGVAPLVEPTAAQVKATVPVIEQTFEAAAIDFDDTYGVKKLNAEQKKQAARIVIQSPEVDPYDAIGSVLERGVALRGEKPKKAPGVSRVAPAAPAVAAPNLTAEQKTAIATMPDLGSIPRLTQTDAPVEAAPVAPPAQRTMNDMAGIGTVNPENTNEVLVEGGGIQLTPLADDILKVDSLRAVEKGGGRKAMQQLTKAADTNGAALQLSPEPFGAEAGKEMSPTELTEWYRGFGFQEQPDGTMVRPAAPTPSTITAAPEFTPQQIVENLDMFAGDAARDQGYDTGMFREGVADIQRGRELLSDQLILFSQGQEALDAYKAGIGWAQERIAEATQASAAPTQAPAKTAPRKIKATGATQGTNAKAVKAAIKRKPGKSAAEKVLNMAQAEIDQTPKEDSVEQVTPYDPEYETIRAKPGINAVRMAKMLGPQLYGDPTNMGQVCIKEVLQNSFDATRTAVNEGQITQGKIDITVSKDNRTLTVKDNGVGMTPELLGGKFLEIAGTAKEGDKNAGGFGIAKMLFLYANKNIRVSTARDGRVAVLDVTGEQLFESLDDPSAAPDIEIRDLDAADQMAFPDGHGTIIQLTIPEEAGEYTIKELPRWMESIPSLIRSPLFANIDVTFTNENFPYSNNILEIGAKFPIQDYTQFVGAKFPWGTAKVYITREQTGQTYGENMHILSNGLWQFSTRVKKEPSDMFSDPVPYTFYVDIVPSVKPDQPGYPFNFNRQNFTDDAKADFGKVKSYIDAIYAYKSRAGEATSFGNIQYFDANGQLGPVIDLTPDIPVQDTAFTNIAEGDQITLSPDGSLLVNGQPMPELTPDQLKAGIPSAGELKVNSDLIDTNAVMVHDNADVVIKSTGEKMSIPDFMRRQFGERFDEFLNFNGAAFLTLRNEVARVMGYSDLYDEAVGVSMDPEYRGVSIRLPFSGSFINPLIPKYGDGLRAGYGIFGTMIHELAHHKVRSHNANFPAEMQDILLNMESDVGFAYQRFKDNFADTIAADYADIVKLGVELFSGQNSDISVEYRGNRFTDGSPEQAPEGTGIGGTGDVRGPSGEGGTGESLFGPAYESRRGAGERGQSGGSGAQPKVVSNGKVVKLTEAQTRTALAKAKATREKMNRIQKRIARTNDTADILGDGIELIKLARGDKENWALLRGAIDTLNVGKWRVILPTLSTEDIFRALKGRIPGLIDADRTIRQDIAKFQTKEYLQLANELETVAEFLKKYPKAAQALSDLEFATVAYQVDPTKAATPEEYFAKVDGKAKEIRAKIKTEKDLKKKNNLEAKLKTRFGEIESVYKGVPGDERVIGWRDLARPEFGGNKGKEIFKFLRDAHRRDLEAKYNALRERLIETKKEEDLDEALEKLEERFKPAREQVIYFPAMRFGSYYARVGKGANSIFKMFETETERNQFVRLMQSRGEDITDTGNVEDLRNNFEQVTGGPLKEVLDLFDDNPKDIGALKSQVFDLWLQTMSAGDMRKHMAPRKMRAGYSTDILKNFANFRRSSINDVKRARYGYKLRTDISRARDLIKEMPDREKLDTFIKEIELRTLSDLMPPDRGSPVWEQAIQFGNKMAFYQYLANPKTAVIQLTQMHIVALPILAQKYGSAKATAALAKYGFSSLGGFVVSPLTSVKKKDGSWSFNWEQPNLLDNPISSLKEESDPELYEVLSEGWAAGRDTNLYMDTFANDIGGFAMVDPEQRSALQELTSGRPLTAALRGATFTFEAMGALMHQMERVNREATYMAALELAYRENKKKGQSHAEAKKNAIDAATDTTLAATFDFSSYNKPRVLTTPVGRISGQFFSYPYMMSSLMVRNMYTAIKFGKLEPGERMAAAQVATGTMVNIGLYAGLTGIPLYGLFKVIGSMLAWLFDDDEEEGGLSYVDADGNIKATYDIDWWFRNVWIPKFFGPEGTVANLFGLDDDTAATLALSMEKGPISAITDIDLANSVALDFMFFVPREPRADTAEGKIVEYTFSGLTGAFGNAVMDYVKAGKDLMNGYTSRALEKAPKLYGNIAKASRFAEEGQLNYNRELVGMDADFWTSDKAILQGLGFASTEAAQRQQQNYEGRTITEKVKKAREGMLSKIRKVALDGYQYGYTPEVMAERQKVMEEWAEFNQTYPTDVIGVDTLYEVQTNAITDALKSKATRGVPLDEKGKTPYLQDIFLRRVEAEE